MELLMPVTIKDIAKIAGVSHTTVSRALLGNPAISTRTSTLIKRLAGEMGYVPSAVAQGLRTRSTHTIGIVVSSIADPFFGKVIEGVEQLACAENYSVFISASHNNREREMAAIETLYGRRVDAIIIASLWLDNQHHAELDRIKVPIVFLNNQIEGEFLHSVAIDDIQGGSIAVEHLLNLGHRRIGFVQSLNKTKSNRQRIEGYQLAHQKAGVPVDPSLILDPTGDRDEDRGKAALAELRAANATAAFCYNDLTAVGLIAACRGSGVRVPEDLSIAGYDDLDLAAYMNPTLTTVRQPRVNLGQSAMQMAVELLNGSENIPDKVLPGELVVRESTAQL